jgi:TonB dependent receptor
VNLVLKATDSTTVHAGYSRYFMPPPFELVTPTAIAPLNNTTAAPAAQLDKTVRAERAYYFDVGVNQVLVPGLTVGLDGYYKLVRNLIDEGQFGAPIILTAFNYAKAYVAGAVFTLSYDQGPWSIYGNAACSRAMGNDIIAAQFHFAPGRGAPGVALGWCFPNAVTQYAIPDPEGPSTRALAEQVERPLWPKHFVSRFSQSLDHPFSFCGKRWHVDDWKIAT